VDEPQMPAAAQLPKKAKGGRMKLLIAVVAVLVLSGAGGAYWFMGTRTAAAPKEPPAESRGLIEFEPFLVNLVDPGGARFLKISVQLVVETAEEAAHVQETPVVLMRLRSEILELLAQQAAPMLVTPEGKEALKKAIQERVSPHIEHEKVLDVLFSEFVVQF
jgi:flagellar FliL protein